MSLTSSIVILFLYVKMTWAQQIKNADCSEWVTPNGLLFTYNCTTDYFLGDWQLYRVPSALPVSIQVIDFKPRNPVAYSGLVLEHGMFKPYTHLKQIVMHKNYNILTITTSKTNLKKSLQELLTTVFVEVSSLEYLEMNECYLDTSLVVHLPANLKSLNFDNNQYQHLDVHWAPNLEEISVKNNSLDEVPKITAPNPKLKILRLSANPLKDMTIEDLARLCELTVLELNFPPNSHYVSKAGYCQCELLKQWASEAELTGVEVECYDQADKPTCSESQQVLYDARSTYKKCPLLKQGVTSQLLYKALKYIFILVILALMLAGLILYTIRHFHLREYWAAHHLSLAQAAASSSADDEDEEEPFKLSEESQDSSIEA